MNMIQTENELIDSKPVQLFEADGGGVACVGGGMRGPASERLHLDD